RSSARATPSFRLPSTGRATRSRPSARSPAASSRTTNGKPARNATGSARSCASCGGTTATPEASLPAVATPRSAGVQFRREREPERGARALAALGADIAAMAVDDPLHRGQADAVAAELRFAVQPLERAEKLVR